LSHRQSSPDVRDVSGPLLEGPLIPTVNCCGTSDHACGHEQRRHQKCEVQSTFTRVHFARPIRRDEGASGRPHRRYRAQRANPLSGVGWGGIPRRGVPPPCKPGFARGQWRRLAEPLQLKREGSASGRDLAGRAGHFGITPATTQRSTHPSARIEAAIEETKSVLISVLQCKCFLVNLGLRD
jgi:hypothetical protein